MESRQTKATGKLQNLTQEQFGSVFSRIGKEVLRSTDLNDFATFHKHDPIGNLAGKPHLVSHDHHCHARQGQLFHLSLIHI